MLKKKSKNKIIKKLNLNNYCKKFFFFLHKIKYFFKVSSGHLHLILKLSKNRKIVRRGRLYKSWKVYFFSDLYDLYFFFLGRHRKYQAGFVKLMNSKFFLVEVKSSLNNIFINLFIINKGKKRLIYYISSGMKFKNSLKSVIFASIRLSDILMGYVRYKKIKNIIVYIYGLEYKILKFFKLFGSYKNQKNFNILYFLVKLNFVFNGVRLKRKKRK